MINQTEIVENLQDVVSLLINEDRWCKRALARDKDGEQLFNAHDDRACQWCIFGALLAFESSTETIQYLKKSAKMWGWSDLDRLNDLNEHYYVIQFLHAVLHTIGGYVALKQPYELVLTKKDQI